MKNSSDIVILRKNRAPSLEGAKRKFRQLSLLRQEISSLLKQLPDISVHIHDLHVCVNADKGWSYIDMPLLYDKEVHADLIWYTGKNAPFSEELGVNTTYELKVGIFSDIASLTELDLLTKKFPRRFFHSETYYLFDKEGNSAKVVDIPEEIQTRREPLVANLPIYRSVMTSEDLVYAERALQVMKHRLEDYWNVKKSSIGSS